MSILLSRLSEITCAADALRSGIPVRGSVALILADALECLATGDKKVDLAKRLGVRPRQGGAYDNPAKILEQQRRDKLIRRLFYSVPAAEKTKRCEYVAAIIRGDAVAPEDAGNVLQELSQFTNLPSSGRHIVRIINGESGRHLQIDANSMTENKSYLSLNLDQVTFVYEKEK